MVCAIGNENGEIFERISIPTETPEITLPKLIEYFKDKEIEALGIGCFGPIDVNRNSEILWLYHDHTKAGVGKLRYCRCF